MLEEKFKDFYTRDVKSKIEATKAIAFAREESFHFYQKCLYQLNKVVKVFFKKKKKNQIGQIFYPNKIVRSLIAKAGTNWQLS